MRSYLVSRLLGMIPTLAIISVIVFTVIQLPEGDIVSSMLDRLQAQGVDVTQEYVENLRSQYNLDKPMVLQYFYWAGNFLTGDMGYSILFNRPVNELVWERLGYTLSITFSALVFTWIVALPIGIYSAVRQYTIGDYLMTTLALVGLATPPFLLALIFMHVGFTWFGISTGGLFSPEYEDAPWSLAKFGDMLAHIWLPMVIVGASGAAFTMRILRANLLDELNKPYVVTARAKGVGPAKLVIKYPVRIAINPFISNIGLMLPALISGEALVGMVMGLPTIGPLLLQSLLNQDMFLAGSLLMWLAALVVIGILISDLLLAWVDPRIRFE